MASSITQFNSGTLVVVRNLGSSGIAELIMRWGINARNKMNVR